MFVKPLGTQYRRFLATLHSRHLFDWYLEVGCRSGESFAPVRSKTIAVDPFFRAEINIIGKSSEQRLLLRMALDLQPRRKDLAPV